MKLRMLVAAAASAVLLFAGQPAAMASPQAEAASCSGTGCDNIGPKGAGCFATQRRIYNTPAGDAELMYSTACKAFWARSSTPAQFYPADVQIEMQKKNSNGRWVQKRRLVTVKSVGERPEWTNALGRRTKQFRFRAVLRGTGGSQSYFTAWKRGGRP